MSIKKEIKITKILPFEFAVDFLVNNNLFFSKPSTWDDPFEKLNDEQNGKMIFAQCWCKTTYSDAMWRIFSQNRGLKNNGPGIQIRTTNTALSMAIKESINSNNFKLRSAHIKYLSLKKYSDVFKNNPEKLLFSKRKAFRHEKEYRFAIVTSNESCKNFEYKNGIKIPLRIPANEIIDSIWIDPFSSHHLAEAISDFFCKHDFKCNQSKIYTEPKEKFRVAIP